MNPLNTSASPYKGLMPYSEEDGPFFFGREDEKNIIIGNLIASRLTLLYGVSGSGKSSVLRAGVSYRLNQIASQNLAEGKAPESIIALFSSWRDDPVGQLQVRIREAITRVHNETADWLSPPKQTLLESLQSWTSQMSADLLVVLDQFEEYFLYNPLEKSSNFEIEFSRAVNHPDLRVNFLISMREDALAKLDRFKGHIPDLFSNYLRIERLTRRSAREAITKPLEEYNRQLASSEKSVAIESLLVEAVLDQVRADRAFLGTVGKGKIEGDDSEQKIELPYLQLVMTRLWSTEMDAGSQVLRLETLSKLGTAERIVRTHLDDRMTLFTKAEQAIAANIFDHLVTPSGSKIAHTVRDLSKYAREPEHLVAKILQDLAGGDVRILRPVVPPLDQPQETRYEVFHDVLALAILDWRERFLQAEKQVVEEREQARELHDLSQAEKEREVALEEQTPSSPLDIKSTDKRIRLHIESVNGDITQVSSPVVVVGQYKGVPPINAVEALDGALDYWISRAHQQRIIGGGLGELFFIPVNRKQIPAQMVLLAGMGDAGKFTRVDLRYLMMVVTYAVLTSGFTSFATVPIGSGLGNLNLAEVVRSTLSGISDALHRLPQGSKLSHIKLVEIDPARSQLIDEALREVKTDYASQALDVRITSQKMPSKPKSQKQLRRPADLPEKSFGPRITIEREGNILRCSALTEATVIPTVDSELPSFFSEQISASLRSADEKQQLELGQLLTTYLIPKNFMPLLDTERPLTLILDRNTVGFPWEMACLPGSDRGPKFFGPDFQLARQFTTQTSSNGIEPPLDRSVRVLVIADPAAEPELRLVGAFEEGRALVELFNRMKRRKSFELEVEARIGPEACNPVEILALLTSCEFDIVHFSGHGVFNDKNPSYSGWVFGKNVVLTPRELYRTRMVPRLVFANAAFSAIANSGDLPSNESSNRNLAGLAEAFFAQGVKNYIGTGWAVEDMLAVSFAKTFYESALRDRRASISGSSAKKSKSGTPEKHRPGSPIRTPLGEALAAARKSILHDGSTWGAYQHYGDQNTLLVAQT